MNTKSWYEEIQDMWIELNDNGLPILVDYDDDMNEVELRKLTPIEYAANLIIQKQWEIFNVKLRIREELYYCVATNGYGINVISDVTENDENDCVDYMGCIYDLSDEQFNDVHTEIISMSLEENSPQQVRQALISEINTYLESGKRLAKPYRNLILSGLYGDIKELTPKPFKLSEWLYPILREVIDEIHYTFDIQIGRNQLNETECAISIVLEAVNRLKLPKNMKLDKFIQIKSYETLRREYYKDGLVSTIEAEFGFNDKQARNFIKKHIK